MDAVLVEERQDLVAEQLQLFAVAHVGQAGGLDQAVGHIDPEAVHAQVEPEAEDGTELVPDGGVVPVEVGLLGGEEVEVPLAVGHPGPGRAAEEGLPVVGRLLAVLAPSLAEVETLAQHRAGALGQPAAEPFVLVGAVVGDQVDDDAQAQVMGVGDDRLGVGQGAEHRVDGAVVGDVVAGVGLRRGVEGAEPDGVHTQVAQVRQAAADARQVPHAVAVAVGEAARVDLVDHRVAPPAGGRSDVVLRGHVIPWWCRRSVRRRGGAGRRRRRARPARR
ncbi:hypothetical protein San01_66620 [Streptomyces angustmyceticus]|uniref:Uncharacterized protein n=1 Tax=Streptomyces angustmyceticus TaxID=285578 RepID=A0A5J4LNT0_9ACTN|nr:hypothetical protein San01_66620 [Streptomyces angustmyceticus]